MILQMKKICQNLALKTVLVAALMAGYAASAGAFSKGMRKARVQGPWELVVQIGAKGQALRFPVKVEDPDKEQCLDRVLPVMGSPVRLVIERYIPNLTWETTVAERLGAGTVAGVLIKGPSLEKKMWLDSNDPKRQALTSSIGRLTLKRVAHASTLAQLVAEAANAGAVGVISVWPKDGGLPHEFIAQAGTTDTLGDTGYQVRVLEYVPHYSIDTKTREVTTRSDKPLNPAVRISIDDGQNQIEQWLWSTESSPHMKNELPLKVKFTDFDLSGMDTAYVIACAPDSGAWLFSYQLGARQATPATLGQVFPFANQEYSFTIESITDGAEVKMEWRNKSDALLQPAIVVSVECNDQKQQAVLELGKVHHQETDGGTAILLYRREPDSAGPTQ